MCFCVTAMRARAMSRGYVIMDAVVPASEPAMNRYAGGTLLHKSTQYFTCYFITSQSTSTTIATTSRSHQHITDHQCNHSHHQPQQSTLTCS